MNRRKYIKQSTLSAFGLLLSPALFASNGNRLLNSFNGKVIIVGAGIAGLYAGHILKSKRIQFQILEADNRYGGRIGKVEGFADFPIDSGAQWLHGKRSLLKKLIKKSKTKIVKDKSKSYYWFKNSFVKKLPKSIETILEGGEDFPDISFLEYAIQNGLGEEYKYILEQIAADQGADSSQLSIKWNAMEEEEWNSGNKDFKFRHTFYDLIDKNIASGISDFIKLNTIIEKIDYSQDKIIIKDRTNNVYKADKVIVTVPITILQDGDIHFTPPFPTKKTDAFKKIGMGAGMKVFLKFKKKFYHQNISGGKICAAYADESIGKEGEDNILLAFIMGKQAEALNALENNEAIINALLKELDEMYNRLATDLFMDAHIENWSANQFVRGAYSYSKVGIENAREVAAQNVNNKIFFAGEAMNLNGHHQTVHGAMESALLQVNQILNSDV